jgi:hypothetical protein
MTECRLDDLIREINPETFSAAAHGEGLRVVYSPKETRGYRKSILERFTASRDEHHYFVKYWRVPKQVTDWRFHWSEGTSAISLDFDCNFVIQANEDGQALQLVRTLARNNKPGEALHSLINAELHAQLRELLRECTDRGASLLDFFRQASIGVGESQRINARVSEAVSQALGGCHFRIGFQLRNAPPLQVEIEWPEKFTLADSDMPHTAKTTALLQLVNYQAYKKSGLETKEAIQEAIQRSISLSVRSLLFGRRYYDVVESFRGAASVETQMRDRLRKEALNIGYDVTMFQTYPDIAALELLNWRRIDMDSSARRYPLKNSTNGVRVAVDLSVRADGDLQRMHLLVSPNDVKVDPPIQERVARLVRDTLVQFDWQQFNLEFDELISPALRANIKSGLSECGLGSQITRVAPEATEDANRFKALRSGTVDFEVKVTAQANVGAADAVTVQGKVAVMGIANTGWECFEAKDYGYRSDTCISETKMRQMAAAHGIAVAATSPLSAEDRQWLAIELEMLDMRDRVVSTLAESMSKVKNLAVNWRSIQRSADFIKWANDICTLAVQREFGLTIALHGVSRSDTDTEIMAKVRHSGASALDQALVQRDIAHAIQVREQSNVHELGLVTNAGDIEQQALLDEHHERHAEVRDAARARLAASASTPRLTAESIKDVLAQPEPDVEEALPWLIATDSTPNPEKPAIQDGSR